MFGKFLVGFITFVFSFIMLWGVLYLCIEPVKEWTDEKIFRIEETAKEEVAEQTNMSINFDTHELVLGV